MDPEDVLKTYKLWRLRASRSSAIHFSYAARLASIETTFLLLTIVSSIFVLATINSDWYSSLNIGYFFDVSIAKLLQSLMSGLTVALSAVLLVHRWGEKSYDHRGTASNYSNFMKKIERYIIEKKFSSEDIHNLYNDFCSIKRDAPIVPRRLYLRSDGSDTRGNIEKIQKSLFEEV